MTTKKTKHLLMSFWFNSDLDVHRYESGWSLSELKEWKEFIEDWYKKEVKVFRSTIVTKK